MAYKQLQQSHFISLINKTNSIAFSPEANYTDWAIATVWRILMPTFVDRGGSRGQRGRIPMAVNLSFLDRSRYFFFQVVPHLSSRGWVDPILNPLLLRKSGTIPEDVTPIGHTVNSHHHHQCSLWPLTPRLRKREHTPFPLSCSQFLRPGPGHTHISVTASMLD
jgi:hypothetical protein